MASTKLRVGLFGAGVVGGGVYELLTRPAVNKYIEIVKVCVKSLNKERDFTISSSTKIVTDYSEILNDPSIDCIVELIGGTTNAKDIVFKAIQSGKHVVTANKALLATFLPEIQELLKNHPSSMY